MKSLSIRSVVMTLMAVAGVLILAPPALAATNTWSGPNNGDFEAGVNWGGTAPADDLTSDIALWNTANAAQLTRSRSINGLFYNNVDGGISSASTSYTLSLGNGGITVLGTWTQPTISANLLVAIDQTWKPSDSSTKPMIISGSLSGSSKIYVTGTGGVKFNGPDNSGFAGTIALNNNTFMLAGGTNNLGPGSTIIMNSGRIGLEGFNTGTIASALKLSGTITFGGIDWTGYNNNSDLAFSGATELSGQTRIYTQTRTDGGSGNVTLGGNISGLGGITFMGALSAGGSAKSLILSGANNTYTGLTTVVAGTLQVGASSRLGVGSVAIHPGARLTAPASGNLYTSQVVTVIGDASGVGVLSLGYDAAPPPMGGTSAGLLALDVAGSYAQSLNMANLGAGTMFLGSTGSSCAYAGSTLGAGSGAAYRLGGGGGTLTFDSAGAGVFTGARDLICGRNGGGSGFAGAVVLADANDFTGAITVNRDSTLTGNAQASGGGSPFGSASGAVALNSGALVLTRGVETTARQAVNKGALAFSGAGQISLDGTSGAQAFLTLASVTRDATYRSGLLVRGLNNSMGTNEKLTVTTPGADLVNDAYGMVRPHYVILTAANNGQFATYGAGSGLQPLAFNETTVANADPGEIVTSPGVAVAAPKTMHALHFQGNVNMTGSSLTITSGGLIGTGDGRMNIGNTIIFPSGVEGVITTLANNNGNALSLPGDIQGDSGFTKLGPQVLSLYQTPPVLKANLTGPITVAQGGLTFNGDVELGPTSNELILNGGGLELGDYGIDISRQIRIGPNGGWLNAGDVNRNNGLYGKITGPGLFTKIGKQKLTFHNTGNDWSGGLNVSGAAVTVMDGSSLGTGAVRLGLGSALYVRGNLSLGSLAGSTASVVIGNDTVDGLKTLTVGSDDTSTLFVGGISDYSATRKGALTKTGAGTMTLLGGNTYTGPSTVDNGTLLVYGSLGTGAVTVATGAAFGGAATIGGSLTFQNNAKVACEFNYGTNDTLQVNGDLVLGANLTLRIANAGVKGKPDSSRDFVLIKYTGADPAPCNWNVEYGSSGWAGAKVKLDALNKRVVVRFSGLKGTVLILR
ncbi:MAG: hypothetical protein C0404_11430 [Verrucomicrobia bacterium]|nr:hypothetical protein [Verrucomicrobiota bacterium]